MKMLLNVQFPHEPFNALVRSGAAGVILNDIMGELKPEAAYFTEQDGRRSVLLVVEVGQPSDVPKLAEPFFLKFNADCRFRIIMSRAELKNAGLEALGKKWA